MGPTVKYKGEKGGFFFEYHHTFKWQYAINYAKDLNSMGQMQARQC